MYTNLATFHKPINCRAKNPIFDSEESAKAIAIQTEIEADPVIGTAVYSKVLVVFSNVNVWMSIDDVKLQP